MRIEDLIKEKLQKNMEPYILEVENQSHLHKGHAGDDGSGQTHFHVLIVSEQLADLSRVQKQRKITDLIQDLFPKGLHAISISAFSPKEYTKK